MKRYLLSAILAIVAAILQTLVFQSSWGERIELWASDQWFHLRGEIPAPKDIVILSMDEQSYKVLGIPMDQAWPRAMHAKMFARLAELGAKRAVMDIIFVGPSSDPEADEALSAGMRMVPTVLGVDTGSRIQGTGSGAYAIEELLPPYELFSQSAEALALVKMPDENGTVRRFDFPRSYITRELPTLFEAAVGKRHSDPDLPGPRDMLWYYGLPGAIPTFSYQTIFESEYPLPLKDKIVFVGLNLRTGVGPMQKDSYATPFREQAMFGIEIQATAAANLLEKHWIRRASAQLETIVLFVATLILVFFIARVRPQWGALILLCGAGVWGLVAYSSFLAGQFIPGMTLFGVTVPATFMTITLVHYLVTYRAQQQVEKAFSLYLPPEMAKEMRTNKNALELGGENIIGTSFFTDIADFTRISESMSATDAAHMLNSYFTHVTGVIFESRGTLIKFIGDAVFVIWGAPLKIKNHAEVACRTALAMQKAVSEFNSLGKFPALHTRIGVHTGSMLVGNLGSNRRFDYTAVGDTVNLSSRLEGANKHFGTTIIVSETSVKDLPPGFNLLRLGGVQVTGKTEPVGIYSLMHDPLPPEVTKVWEEGVAAFEARRWHDAVRAFSKIISQAEHLGRAAALFLKMIAKFNHEPPDEDWRGELILPGK